MKKIEKNPFEAEYLKAPIFNDKYYIEFHKAIGDAVRHDIFKMVVQQPGITGKEIFVMFHESQPTISFHIKLLKKYKLVLEKKVGITHHYYPNYSTIASIHKTIIYHHIQANDPIGQFYKKYPRNFNKKKK